MLCQSPISKQPVSKSTDNILMSICYLKVIQSSTSFWKWDLLGSQSSIFQAQYQISACHTRRAPSQCSESAFNKFKNTSLKYAALSISISHYQWYRLLPHTVITFESPLLVCLKHTAAYMSRSTVTTWFSPSNFTIATITQGHFTHFLCTPWSQTRLKFTESGWPYVATGLMPAKMINRRRSAKTQCYELLFHALHSFWHVSQIRWVWFSCQNMTTCYHTSCHISLANEQLIMSTNQISLDLQHTFCYILFSKEGRISV